MEVVVMPVDVLWPATGVEDEVLGGPGEVDVRDVVELGILPS